MYKVRLLSALIVLGTLLVPAAFAADPVVIKALAEAEKHARAEKTFRGAFTNAQQKAMDKQCQDGIKQIKGLTGGLTAPQLVELISLSERKMHQNHYVSYFESVVAFALRRLGNMSTAEASQCLKRAHELIRGQAALTVVWDEAKEKQNKLLQSAK